MDTLHAADTSKTYVLPATTGRFQVYHSPAVSEPLLRVLPCPSAVSVRVADADTPARMVAVAFLVAVNDPKGVLDA